MNIRKGREFAHSDMREGGRLLFSHGPGALSVVTAMSAALFFGTPLTSSSAEPPAPETFGSLYHCNPGPWGDLQYYYIYLEAPDRVVENMTRPDPVPKWSFPNATEDQLRMLFTSAGLSNALQEYLLSPKHRVLENGTLSVFPPLPDVLAMTPRQRSIIYAELAKSELNPMYVNPACIFDRDIDAWLSHAELRPEIFDAVRKLTYPRGDTLCFSDLAAILAMVESEEEALEFMKAMSRTRSLVLQLNLKSSSDFEEVVRYWAGDGNNKQVASIILPAAKAQLNESLDCLHLLPPLPRRYLNTFPSEELGISADRPDCNWTSFNFFSSSPLNYHTEERLLLLQLNERYTKVAAPYRFGDILMFDLPNGGSLHSCVYIADEIVYTKNGQYRFSPWILSKIKDVETRYSYNRSVTIQGYRLKPKKTQE